MVKQKVILNLIALIAMLSGFVAFVMKQPKMATPFIIIGIVMYVYLRGQNSQT